MIVKLFYLHKISISHSVCGMSRFLVECEIYFLSTYWEKWVSKHRIEVRASQRAYTETCRHIIGFGEGRYLKQGTDSNLFSVYMSSAIAIAYNIVDTFTFFPARM